MLRIDWLTELRQVLKKCRCLAFSTHQRRRARGASPHVSVIIDLLESRQLLTGITVDTAGDTHQAGHTTLREAIAQANGYGSGDTITFSPSLAGQTIVLTQGQLEIDASMTITGLGASNLRIDGNASSTLFRIGALSPVSRQPVNATITGFALQNGSGSALTYPFSNYSDHENGAAITNEGTLTLADCTVSNNHEGAAIVNRGRMSLSHNTISSNVELGIANSGSLTSKHNTLSGSHPQRDAYEFADFDQGISIYNTSKGKLESTSDTISGNTGYGIYSSGQMKLSNDEIFGNGSRYSQGYDYPLNSFGGGVSNSGFLTIIDTTVSDNVSQNGGGIYNTGTLTSSKNTIARNTGFIGGGVFNSGLLTTSNDAIYDNESAQGGGIYNSSTGASNVSNDAISGNKAFRLYFESWSLHLDGGGIYNAGTMISSGNVVSGNYGEKNAPAHTIDRGGAAAAVYNDINGVLTTTHDTLSGNKCRGIANFGTLTSGNNRIYENSAPEMSGAGVANFGTMTSTSDVIFGNRAYESGGLENQGYCVLTNDTVFGNSALSVYVAAGGIGNEGTLTAMNCTISGNSSSASGGGVHNTGTFTAVDSTIAGNTASENGGGIWNGGAFTSINCTISGNAARKLAGGVWNNGTLNAVDSIVAGNTQSSVNEIHGSVSGSSSHNQIMLSAGQSLSQFVKTDANGKPILANNGGSTQTIALVAGSAAVSAGGPIARVMAAGDTKSTTLFVDRTTFLAVGELLRIGGEIVRVTAVPSSTMIAIQRAQSGTRQGNLNGLPVRLAYDQRGVDRITDDIGSVTFDSSPRISSPSGAAFVVAASGSFTFKSTGYPAATYRVTGTLPKGLKFNSVTGVVSGTPEMGTVGTYALIVTASNGVGASAIQELILKVVPAVASKLVFTRVPKGTATAGVALYTEISVAVEDPYGDRVTTYNSTVTLTVGTHKVTAKSVNGIAVFKIGPLTFKASGNYSWTASDGALTNATSRLIISAGAAAKLVFNSAPDTGSVATGLASAVTFLITDVLGNVVTGNTSAVTLMVASAPIKGQFKNGSSITVNAVNGKAVFAGLKFTKAGTYTVKATDGKLTFAESKAFVIV